MHIYKTLRHDCLVLILTVIRQSYQMLLDEVVCLAALARTLQETTTQERVIQV